MEKGPRCPYSITHIKFNVAQLGVKLHKNIIQLKLKQGDILENNLMVILMPKTQNFWINHVSYLCSSTRNQQKRITTENDKNDNRTNDTNDSATDRRQT